MNLPTSETTQHHADSTASLRMVLKLMDRWQLDAEQRASVLAMGNDESNRSELFYLLLATHKQLQLLFPVNRQLAYRWMTSRNDAFGGLKPIELVQRQGAQGLQMIHHYLQRLFA